METSSTVFKALDALTILTAREEGISLPDLALALNQPRSNVVRIVRTLQQYGLVTNDGRRWIASTSFRAWSALPDRHLGFRQRYHSIVRTMASATGELVVLGLHEGNGIIHLDAIESTRPVCRAPAPDVRYSLRSSALGKLALSRRPDLAQKFNEPTFQRELSEVRRTQIAWTRGENARGLVGMAIPGFSNGPTEPMLAVTWSEASFTEAAAENARRAALDAMEMASRETRLGRDPWTEENVAQSLRAISVA